MPRFYRSMLNDNGKPVVGADTNMLGVRVPPHGHPDIVPDVDGNVHRETGGLSVVPTWRDLPYFLIPKRLKPIIHDARGKNELACFGFGEGSFAQSSITDELILKPDSPRHATIQPSMPMPLGRFQQLIAETRFGWKVDET